MSGNQGTFWDGISTTPFRRVRRGMLSTAEAERRRKQRWAKWYREHGRDYIQQRRVRLIATDATFLDKERARSRKHARKRIGITEPTDETRLGPCEICGKVKPLHMDHDHASGAKRGWLCVGCNTKLDWCLKNREAIEQYARSA